YPMNAKVWLVGAGPGDPELLTLKAVRALGEAQVVMIDDLVNPAVLEHCPNARIIPVGKRGGCRRVRGEHGFDGVAGRRGGGAGGIGLVFRGCAAIEIEVERRARRRRKFARAGVGQIGIGRPNGRRAGVGLGPRVGRALAGRRRAAGWRFGRFEYRRGVVR
ncbi:SAM-dependent methyltransferase, partial [Citrobacter sp. VF227]